MAVHSVRRPRTAILLVCIPLVVIYLLVMTNDPQWTPMWGSVHSPTSERAPGLAHGRVDSTSRFGSTRPASSSARIPADAVAGEMLDYLRSVWDKFDDERHREEYGLKVGNVALDQYTRELEDFYTRFLAREGDVSETDWLTHLFNRLSIHPPAAPYPPLPSKMSTTDKNPLNMHPLFSHWKEVMPKLDVVVYDDRQLEIWADDLFGGTEFHNIWRRLPRIVLKSDIFRYLVLLVEGGIYGDSDTAPIIPASEWGIPYESRTPGAVKHLSQLLHVSDSKAGAVDEGGEKGPPSLIVSVESDAFLSMSNYTWRENGLARAVQITQWTMMARPGHPVFLDVVGRALEKTLKIEQDRAAAEASGEEYIEEWALEWTGPGVWTDCVHRYLISRYGFAPDGLIGLTDPIRVGDVLILPSMSFGAIWPDEDGKKDKKWDAVAHSFEGRWRHDDPGLTDFYMKQQKAAEEAKRKKKEEAAKKQGEGG